MNYKYLTLLLILICNKALGQEKNLDEVVLHGKLFTTPYTKVVENFLIVTRADIENSAATSIDEVLQNFSGMDIQRRGANGVQSDVSMRGGTFEQVLILLNGVRMNDAQTGHNSLNIPVDLDAIDKIEIIKGPAARRFGQNAYTGVINIITKTSSENKAKISLSGGDFKSYAMGMAATFGKEKFQNLVQIQRSVSDGYRYNTDYELTHGYFQTKYLIQNGSIGFQGGISEKKFGANGFYATPLATEQYEELQSSLMSLTYHQNFNQFSVNSNLYWRRGQDKYLYNREKPELYRNIHIGNNAGLEVSGNYQSSLGRTGVGVDLRKEYLSSNNLGKRERFITQIFFEHQFSFFSDRFIVSPGLSWDNVSGTGNYFYPGLDVGYSFNKFHKLSGNIARVTRIPSYTELFYDSKTEQGNANLKPEKALSAEIGYRYHRNNFTFNSSLFIRNTKNAIDWKKNNEMDKWIADNVASIETKGFEVEVMQKLPTLLHSNIHLSYAYLDSNYRTPSFSKYIAKHLRHQLIAKLETPFLKNFTNQITYKYLKRANTGNYGLLDEKLSYRKNNLETYILINNLTNTNYTEAFGVPMPKRWFHIGISYTVR